MNLPALFKNFLLNQDPAPSKVTVKNYVSDINKFISWYEAKFKKNFSPSDISFNEILDFKTDSLKKFSASSVDRNLSSLRKFFTFLKLEAISSKSPFDEINEIKAEAEKIDPWRIRDFKNNLYVFNASHLTIKNYIIDVKQFLNWAESKAKLNSGYEVKELDHSLILNPESINEYKHFLLNEAGLSPVSVNRKLSSLRKYSTWAKEEGIITQDIQVPGELKLTKNNELRIMNNEAGKVKTNETIAIKSQIINRQYSVFPPVRLAQKVALATEELADAVFILPIVDLLHKAEYKIWKAKGMPVTNEIKNQKTKIKNISRNIYAPESISISSLPIHRKTLYHIKYTRPQWYKRYQSTPLFIYFRFAVIVLFLSALSYSVYSYIDPNKEQPKTLAAPTAPPRVLSFQGRLTDNSDNPITSQTAIRMSIYNSSSASGSALLWEEIVSPIPDNDGIFSVILGNNTTIPLSVFAENSALWLGVTVGQTAELTPRQQIATVAFATNAETLQGLEPITNSASTSNVVLALNSSGNLVIGGSASPVFQATGGSFTVAGQTLLLNTNTGSNGNITLTPDGIGKVNISKPIINSTNNNNISTAVGAVEVNDLFAILATSSGQSAFTLNQESTGPLISASASGVSKFTVDNGGNITSAGTINGLAVSGGTISSGTWNGTAIGSQYGGTGLNTSASTGVPTISSGTWSVQSQLSTAFGGLGANVTAAGAGEILYSTGTTTYDSLPAGSSTQCLLGGTTPSWGSCSAGGTDSPFQVTAGAINPLNSTLDFLIGGQTSTSAKFSVLNVNSGTPTASISANSGANATFLTGDGSLATTNGQTLTIGGANSGTGNINIQPRNATGGLNGLDVSILASSTTGGSSFGGDLTLGSGNGVNGGDISITAGTTTGSGNGGNITLQSGSGAISGSVNINTSSDTPTNIGTGTNTGTITIGKTSSTNLILNDANWSVTGAGAASFASVTSTGTIDARGDISDSTGNLTLNDAVDISGITTLTSNLNANGGLDVDDAFVIADGGILTTSQTANFDGAADFDGAVDLGTAVTISDTDVTLNGANTTFTTTGDLTLTVGGGNIISSSPLNIGGAAATAYNFFASSTAGNSIADSASDLYIQDELEVDGNITLGNFSNCTALETVSGVLTCGTDDTGSGGTNYWRIDTGALSPVNDTLDFLIGSAATTSAKFAVLNVNTGTPVASISANSGNNATYLTGDGSLGTTNRQSLVIGNSTTYNTSGNVFINPNGTGRTAIGTTNTASTNSLVVGGASGDLIRLYPGTGLISESAFVTLNARGRFGYDGSLTAVILSDADAVKPLAFLTSPGGSSIERLRITTTGTVGVGTDSPISQLHVTRPLSFTATGKALAIFDQIENQDILTASKSGVTQFTVQSDGDLITVGDLDLNGDDLRTDGDLTITPAGGNIISSSPLNIGGAAATAYNFFADSTAGNSTAVGDNDLYIEDDLEVDGTITGNVTGALTGNASTATALAANGTNCSAGSFPLGVDASGNAESCATVDSAITADSLDFIDFADSMTVDAATDINLGANTLSIDLDSTGDFSIRDVTTDIATFANTGAITFAPTSGQSLSINLAAAGDLIVNTNDLVVDTSTGRVGIGNSAPSASLHVSGGDIFMDAGQILSFDASSNPTFHYIKKDGNDFQFGSTGVGNWEFANTSVGARYFTVGISTGLTGIGTETPTSALYVTRPIATSGYTATGKALAIFDQIENQDILTASKSGVTQFTVESTGTIDIASGATFQINNTNVLSSTTLGTGVITSSLTTVGALNAGSITSGFGAIDIGADTLTAGGATFNGNVDMTDDLILNIGNAGTDFTAGGGLTLAAALISNGNTTIGNANTDTLTINAGSSGTGITFGDSSFATCSALETVAGVLTCGTDDTGSGGTNYFRLGNGALSPVNDTLDFLIGSAATTSAKFAVTGINGTGPATASVSGKMIIMPTNGAGGNLGIGTITPTSEIDIIANHNNYAEVSIINSNAGSDAAASFYAQNDLGAYMETGVGSSGHTLTPILQNRAFLYTGSTSDGLVLYTSGADPIIFALDDDESARFSATGLFGLGTAAPISKLHVTHDISTFTATGKALAIFDQIENQDILTASKSGVTQFTVQSDGDLITVGDLDLNGDDLRTDGDLTIDPAGNNVILGSGDYLSVGGSTQIGQITAITSASDPANGIDTFGVTTTGAYGGGIGLQDGTTNFGIWTSVGGDDLLIFGHGTSLGALTQVASIDEQGDFSLSGTTITASSLTTLTTAATLGMTSTTTLNLGSNATLSSNATALNLEENGGVDINLGGGSGATGCTVTNSSGAFACAGAGTFAGGTFNGNLDMTDDLILNIGNAGTDFTAGGGLTLAELLTVNDDVDFVLATGENLFIDAATTDSTVTTGVIDLNIDAGNAAVTGLNIDIEGINGIAAGTDIIGGIITITQSDADADFFGLQITNGADTGTTAGADDVECLLCLDNAEATAGVISNAIRINNTSGTGGAYAVGINMDGGDFTRDIVLEFGEAILNQTDDLFTFEDDGGTDYATLSLTALTIAGDLTITGNDITNTTLNLGNGSAVTIGTISDDNLTITPNGTGNSIISVDFNTGLQVSNIAASSNTLHPLFVNGGISNRAAFVVNNTNSGDIITASASGTTVFTVGTTGILTLLNGETIANTTNGDIDISATNVDLGSGNLVTNGYIEIDKTQDWRMGMTGITGITNCAAGVCWVKAGDANPDKMSLNASGNLITRGTMTASSNPDIAEAINVIDQTIEEGDIVTSSAYNPNESNIYYRAIASKTTSKYEPAIIGAISEDPAIFIRSKRDSAIDSENRWTENERPLVLAGRIPVKVSSINGEIKVGDYITSSDVPGVGMKASEPGQIVGIAMEPYNNPDTNQVGKILVFIKPGFTDPDIKLSSSGNLSITPTVNNNFEIQRNGSMFTRIGGFSEIVTAKIRVGLGEFQIITSNTLTSVAGNFGNVTTDSLALLTSNITIAGENIEDFIARIADERIEESGLIISPIETEGNNIIAKLPESDSKFIIENSSGSAVAIFDQGGNASFSGLLSSQGLRADEIRTNSLDVSGNASISGVLRADRIIANQIEGLNIQAATVSANYITNNYYLASESGQISTPSGFFNAEATGSADFGNLSASTATFTQGLMAFGPASFFEASVADTLYVGSQLSLAGQSMNVLGGNLQIQNLRQGGIDFLAGLVKIDIDGNLTVEGNATFAKDVKVEGKLSANIIAPIPGKDLIFELPEDKGIQFKSGTDSARLAINNKGDLISSGSGNFAKLNLNIINEVEAVSDIEINATGSAGLAEINENEEELTINNPLVTEKSLIYITPKTSLPNQNIYLIRQTAENPEEEGIEGSFTVGISNIVNKKVPFNWIIIN